MDKRFPRERRILFNEEGGQKGGSQQAEQI